MKPITYKSYFCTECKTECTLFLQGLSCSCDQPWLTEVYHSEDYPKKWIECRITIDFPTNPETYWEAYNLPEDIRCKCK